jgi:hypothetical protein
VSLFSKLQRLVSRPEDFNTEIVAHVLRNSPELTRTWLADDLKLTTLNPNNVIVMTQEQLDPLETHDDRGSRPDISIRLKQGDQTELIFIESKIGSKEITGPNEQANQLQRYFDQLAAKSNLNKRSLLYITRDFEPKNEPKSSPEIKVEFRQRRWFEFYRFFKAVPEPSEILKELLQFMEENNMTQSNQFAPIDVIAITNFQKAKKVMDATLDDSVSEKFALVCGKGSSLKRAINDLADYSRYTLTVGHSQGWQFYILLGYWLSDESATNYPTLGVSIEVNPNAAKRSDIIAAIADYAKFKKGTWESQSLDNENEWGTLFHLRGLDTFFGEKDQVKAIQSYFKTLLNDINEFRKRYPKLPWTAQSTANDGG